MASIHYLNKTDPGLWKSGQWEYSNLLYRIFTHQWLSRPPFSMAQQGANSGIPSNTRFSMIHNIVHWLPIGRWRINTNPQLFLMTASVHDVLFYQSNPAWCWGLGGKWRTGDRFRCRETFYSVAGWRRKNTVLSQFLARLRRVKTWY